MKKWIPLVFLGGLLLLASCQQVPHTTTNGTTEKEKVTVVLDWTPNTNHTGLYVAQEKGYFAEQGLEVAIVQPPEDGAASLVASKKADFGISFQDYLVPAFATDNPLPITAVAALVNHNTSGLLSLSEKNIRSPKDLVGHTYATWDLPIEQAIIKNVVEADGGDFNQVTMIPSTVLDVVGSLQTTSDSVWVFYAWDGIGASVKGLDTHYIAFRDLNPVFDYYSPVLIANNDVLTNKPELAKRFLTAVKKGYEFAVEQPEESAKILVAAAPELDAELVQASQAYLSKEYIADAPRWGYIDAERWNDFYDWLYVEGLIDQEIPDNFGFDNEWNHLPK